KNSTSRRYIDEKFSVKNIPLTPQIEVAAHDLLLRFASIHLGIACVVEEFSKERLEQGFVRKLNVQPSLPPRSIGCAYLKHTPLSLAAQAFLKLIHETEK
ncbi:MAG: LysR family transcriptional regulator, partial [Ruminococcaceae bacterium]|nr:LysR family transcriptional regulator [Oscillospiraceae bacterium]